MIFSILISACGADPCGVEETSKGAVISCPDGTHAEIENGQDGEEGPQGEQGDEGDRGPQGEDGARGEPGEDGEMGEQGTPGADGENGSPGEPGTDGLDGEPGQDGDICNQDPWTIPMLHDWSEAETYRRDCWNKAQADYGDCLELAETAELVEDCFSTQLYDESRCMQSYSLWINDIPRRACGAYIAHVSGSPDDGTFEFGVEDDEDSDGDGISNYREYTMGYNPCTPNSFGCNLDAELDFDNDGIPNSEDDYPNCNSENPGATGWVSPCI